MSEKVKILRVVEYEGPREAVERQVAHSLHGEKTLMRTGVTIRAASLPEKEADYFRVSMCHMLQNLQVLEDDWTRPPSSTGSSGKSGVFRPIRAASDYDPSMVGETRTPPSGGSGVPAGTLILANGFSFVEHKLTFACGHMLSAAPFELKSDQLCPTCIKQEAIK